MADTKGGGALNLYFESLNSYLESLNSYFETVADTRGGGGQGGSNPTIILTCKKYRF